MNKKVRREDENRNQTIIYMNNKIALIFKHMVAHFLTLKAFAHN